MAWVATAVIAAVSVVGAKVQADREDDARKDAEEQAKRDRAEQLRATQFAETEGEGHGQLGNITLAIDEEVDSDLLSGKSNLAI